MTDGRDIRRIRATKVLGEFDYDVDFAPDGAEGETFRMRVIYAQNGRGKTNLLRAVSFALNPTIESLQALIDIPIGGLKIDFLSGASIVLSRENAAQASYTISAASGNGIRDEVQVEPADFAGRLFRRVWDERSEFSKFAERVSEITSGAVLIGDDRLSLSVEDVRELSRPDAMHAPPRRRVGSTTSRLLERVERTLTQNAFASLSREGASTDVYASITKTTLRGSESLTAMVARQELESQISDVMSAGTRHERYGLISLRQVREIRKQLNQARANDKNLPALHRILTPYLASLSEQVESLLPAHQLIDTFVTAVNGFLDRKELVFSASTGISLKGRSGARLNPDSLSSGERHLIFLLSHALLATEQRPLVILDEPELSLGIDWQRQLLKELLRCSESAAVQFLVASHSVQVMSGIDREDIVRPVEA